ncbi:MAG TPA: GFA family protein [Kofleriaceae bacterium]|nr:GFA family protein [Kofleriaceae bacterium]
MTTLKLPARGACRCGQVQIEITAPPLLTMACHCRGCQRMASSAFSLSVAVPSAGFAVVQGEPVIGGLHGPTKHFFCPHCMTWMFTRPEGLDWLVNVRTTMLDDAIGLAPFIETYTEDKLPWVTTGAVHSFAKLPSNEGEHGYEGLVKAFAARAV